MPDFEKTISKKIEKLSVRLEKLETNLAQYGRRPGAEIGAKKQGDRPQYCGLPEVEPRRLARTVSSRHERLIRYVEKKWVNGTKLHYYLFRDGPFAGAASQLEYVREGFDIWENVEIGLQFEEVDDINAAELRIGFLNGDGSWSYVGRDSIDIPGQFERTMNIGWNLDHDPRGVDVAVHEIGHALGFPHEHQNPFAGIVWEEEAVYAYFGGPPNNWSRQETFHNVLRKLPGMSVEGGQWDPNSIMHYSFDAGLIREPQEYAGGLAPELGLSEADKAEVRRFYPPLANSAYKRLDRFRAELLSLSPAEQENFIIEPEASRKYTIQTFGDSDVVMVLFEERDGEHVFLTGDDDSGAEFNAKITHWLKKGTRYLLRIRMYLNYASGDCAVMYW